EAAPPHFDWEYLLSGHRRQSRGVLAVLGLAQRLLGACVGDQRIAQQAADSVPPWMIETIRWRWGSGRERRPLAPHLRHPREAVHGLLYDGLNPIKAAFRLGVCPRYLSLMLPVQLAAFLARTVEIPRRAQHLWRRRLPSTTPTFVKHRDQLI